MRIRSLMFAAILTAVLLGVGAAALVFAAARVEEAADAAQGRAREVANEVTGLLTLTQEFGRYQEPRAAEQWHLRHRTIMAALERQPGVSTFVDSLNALRSLAQAMPELFSRLEKIPSVKDDFARRRQEALLDQLLSSTQSMSDLADQWFEDASAERRHADAQFKTVAIAAPIVMLLMFVALTAFVRHRILLPVQRLAQAAAAVGEGDLGVRIASEAADEFGELSRRFDSMTTALETSRETALQAARRLKEVTDNMPALISYIDRDEIYRFTNAHYGTVYGVDPESFIGKTIAEGLGAPARAAMAPHIEAALRGERRTFERHGVKRNSAEEQVDTHLMVNFVPDVADGKVEGFYVMVSDISERKNAELAQLRSERRLRAITDNIPAMIGHFDAQERCLFANAMVLKLNGFTAADIPHHTLRSGIGEEAYALHEPHIQAVLRGESRTFEGHVQRKGRDAYFQAHMVPDRGDDGTPCGFYLMSFDVTAVRRAEIARALGEQRLRQITDNLPVLIAYIDREERFDFVNKTYEDWMGIDASSLPGRRVADVFSSEYDDVRRESVQRALQGERVDLESELRTPRGARITQTAFVPDVDAQGNVLGVYALTTDVTSLKEIERKLKALARFDPLTGLPNRLYYNEKLPEALARAHRSRQGLALMFLDIDRFKLINDTLGHAAGDAVLKEFAHRLRRCVRQTDTVVRLAGDEFVIVLEALNSPAEPEPVADKILTAMRMPFVVDGQMLTVTTSVGISFHDGSVGSTTPGDLLERADRALYDAKSAGRNTRRMAV